MSDIVKAVLVLVIYNKVETEYRFDFKNDSYSYTAGKSYSSSYRNIKTSGWYLSCKAKKHKYLHYFKIKNYRIV